VLWPGHRPVQIAQDAPDLLLRVNGKLDAHHAEV